MYNSNVSREEISNRELDFYSMVVIPGTLVKVHCFPETSHLYKSTGMVISVNYKTNKVSCLFDEQLIDFDSSDLIVFYPSNRIDINTLKSDLYREMFSHVSTS